MSASDVKPSGMRPARRTVVKGAAWAVPAVVVASAAPARAQSPDPIEPSYSPGTFCKHSSNNSYHAVFCFDNTTEEDIVVNFVDMTVAGATRGGPILPGSVTVCAGMEMCFYVDGTNFSAMPNAHVTLTFSYEYDGDVLSGSIDTSGEMPPQGVSVCGTNPVQDQPGDDPPHDPACPGGCPTCP